MSDAGGRTDTATVRITVTSTGQTTPPGGSTGTAGSTGGPTLSVATSTPAGFTRKHPCQGRSVGHLGSWRVVQGRAPGGSYCDNGGRGTGRDVLRLGFEGDKVDVVFGRAKRGGKAVLFIDGDRVGRLSFKGRRTRPRLHLHAVIRGLGDQRPHRLRLVVKRGRAHIEGFRTLG